MRRLLTACAVLSLLAIAAPAQAAPAGGTLRLSVLSGISHEGSSYVMKGQRVKVRARVRPFIAGQYVRLAVYRAGKRVVSERLLLRPSGPGVGQLTLAFRAKHAGLYTVRARHIGTSLQRTLIAARKRVRALHVSAGSGSSGLKVELLQKGLRRLGYAGVPLSGRYDGGTSRGVLAFRKVNKLGRNSFAGRRVYSLLLRGRGGFRLKHPRAGKHVEADLSRQVLVLARDGRAERIYHTASGKASTPTVRGSFRFYRKSPGTNSHGMVHSSYFIGGYAIHGYPSVPPHPASHGCLRVPIPNALSIYRWIDLGDRIFVYR